MNTSLSKTTIYNIISVIMIEGIAFFTMPVFTRILGNSEFGRYHIFLSWVVILSSVMDLGVVSTIGTGFYKYKDNYYKFRYNIIGIVLLSSLSFLILLISGLFVLNKQVLFRYCIAVWLYAFCKIMINLFSTCYIYEKRPQKNLIISVTTSVGSTILSLLLVLYFIPGYVGRVTGEIVVFTIVVFILIIVFVKGNVYKFQKDYISFSMIVGLPIIFHLLARNILSQSDRIMMNHFGINDGLVGIYSFFFSFCGVINILLTALNNSFCPFYYDYLDDKNYKELNDKTKHYVEFFSVLSLGFLMLSREVSYIMADKTYSDGLVLVPVIIMCFYFVFLYLFPVNFEFYSKETRGVAIGSILAAIINIILNYIMIPIYGMMGAAIATMLAYALLFVFHYIIVKIYIKSEYPVKSRVFLYGLLAVVIGGALFYLLAKLWIIRWILALMIGLFELYRVYKRRNVF